MEDINDLRRPAPPESLDSALTPEDLAMDAAGLDGSTIYNGVDRSLARGMSNYDEDSGPGGASGIADDPELNGSTGTADDVGMHIEEGFSNSYDQPDLDTAGITPDAGNDGGYLSLGDAADGMARSTPEGRVHNALGVPEGELPFTDADDDRYSLDRVSDGDAGYGYSGTDSDNNLNEAAS
jgi:hypothetical protein